MAAYRGQRFTHKHFIDPGWEPGPGEKYRDAPKAEMVVTRVTLGGVYYGYAQTGKGGWYMDRPTFEQTYPANTEPTHRWTGGVHPRLEVTTAPEKEH